MYALHSQTFENYNELRPLLYQPARTRLQSLN